MLIIRKRFPPKLLTNQHNDQFPVSAVRLLSYTGFKIAFIMNELKTKIRNRLEEDRRDLRMRIEKQGRHSWRVGVS